MTDFMANFHLYIAITVFISSIVWIAGQFRSTPADQWRHQSWITKVGPAIPGIPLALMIGFLPEFAPYMAPILEDGGASLKQLTNVTLGMVWAVSLLKLWGGGVLCMGGPKVVRAQQAGDTTTPTSASNAQKPEASDE